MCSGIILGFRYFIYCNFSCSFSVLNLKIFSRQKESRGSVGLFILNYVFKALAICNCSPINSALTLNPNVFPANKP